MEAENEIDLEELYATHGKENVDVVRDDDGKFLGVIVRVEHIPFTDEERKQLNERVAAASIKVVD